MAMPKRITNSAILFSVIVSSLFGGSSQNTEPKALDKMREEINKKRAAYWGTAADVSCGSEISSKLPQEKLATLGSTSTSGNMAISKFTIIKGSADSAIELNAINEAKTWADEKKVDLTKGLPAVGTKEAVPYALYWKNLKSLCCGYYRPTDISAANTDGYAACRIVFDSKHAFEQGNRDENLKKPGTNEPSKENPADPTDGPKGNSKDSTDNIILFLTISSAIAAVLSVSVCVIIVLVAVKVFSV